jgi:hypothetical protein
MQKLNVQYTNFGRAYHCKMCGHPLLMDGCDNENCINYYLTIIRQKKQPPVTLKLTESKLI